MTCHPEANITLCRRHFSCGLLPSHAAIQTLGCIPARSAAGPVSRVEGRQCLWYALGHLQQGIRAPLPPGSCPATPQAVHLCKGLQQISAGASKMYAGNRQIMQRHTQHFLHTSLLLLHSCSLDKFLLGLISSHAYALRVVMPAASWNTTPTPAPSPVSVCARCISCSTSQGPHWLP